MVPGSDEHTLYALLDEIQTDTVSREIVGLVVSNYFFLDTIYVLSLYMLLGSEL